jgi:drug/metabolite transporter (DMT)-like permease
MSKVQTNLIYFGSFILGLTIAIFSEDNFHELLRHLYVSLTSGKISFDLPKLDLYFFSFTFVFTGGLYFVVLPYFIGRQNKRQILINICLTLLLLLFSTILDCYFDANFKLIECTACDDGTRVLLYSDIEYTKIFITTLLTSLLPFIWTEIKTRRKTKRQKLNQASL